MPLDLCQVPHNRLGEAPKQHNAYYLAARGYGVHGDYGNGNIMVNRSDVIAAFVPAIGEFEARQAAMQDMVAREMVKP